MVQRSVLQWTRGKRVPLSLYERTFFAVLHFHFMTAFQRRPKRRGVFLFPNNHRRPSKVFFFLFLQRFSSLFFLLSVYDLAFFFILTTPFLIFFSTFSIRPSIASLFHCPTDHECRRFRCQNRMKKIFLNFNFFNFCSNRNIRIYYKIYSVINFSPYFFLQFLLTFFFLILFCKTFLQNFILKLFFKIH